MSDYEEVYLEGDQPTEDERLMAALCHGLFLISSFIGPLIIWLIKKEESRYIDQQGKEALNFQISLMIYSFITFLLCFVGIGILLIPVLGIFALVFNIIATIKAYEGKRFRYPCTIRII